MNQSAIRFKPLIDGSTWGIIAFVVAGCSWPLLLEQSWLEIAIILAALAMCIFPFFSIWYEIDGEELVIYQFFRPSRFPISKIKEIAPTKSILSAPATSLKCRIAISFIDRKVLKSSMPLIISPANQDKFIETLLSINPNIKIK